MYLNIIECDRCQKRSEDPSDSKSYVYIQWYVDEKGRKELHLCPSCSRMVADCIITPRFAKLRAISQNPFELSYSAIDEAYLLKAREDMIADYLPNT